MRITNKVNELHSSQISFDENTTLTTGEIHLIECIGKHKDVNVTEIAKILGNTKGAVSQMAKKLQNKGLIIKTKREDNNKDILLNLSNYGNKIFIEHEKLHADLYKEIISSIDNSTQENLKAMKNILNIIEKHTDNYKKKYQ